MLLCVSRLPETKPVHVFLTFCFITIAYKGLDVNRVRLVMGDSKGPALIDKKKTLNDYSKCNNDALLFLKFE